MAALGSVADFTGTLFTENKVTASCLGPFLNYLCTEALVEAEGNTTLKTPYCSYLKPDI